MKLRTFKEFLPFGMVGGKKKIYECAKKHIYMYIYRFPVIFSCNCMYYFFYKKCIVWVDTLIIS